MENIEFERSKIYEKLAFIPQPTGYRGTLPWNVQLQIAATNGKHYKDRVGKLKGYPGYELPVKKVQNGLMLDIGPGWGRWMVAGSRKGYLPVGADLRLEFCQAALHTLKAQGLKGYTVVADLKELPFANDIFDLVWSYSVIQHTHKARMVSCLQHIHRILKANGFTKLQFPNRNGIRNSAGPVKISAAKADNYDSWVVRYYSIKEYKDLLTSWFQNFSYTTHCFLGLGVLKEDIKYVSIKNKLSCSASLILTGITKLVSPLIKFADSIYVEAHKTRGQENKDALKRFHEAHNSNPDDNLNIVHLLQCPVSKQPLRLASDRKTVVTADENISYPVVDDIPILISSEAIKTKTRIQNWI